MKNIYLNFNPKTSELEIISGKNGENHLIIDKFQEDSNGLFTKTLSEYPQNKIAKVFINNILD
jgi:hypothetical protein